MPIFNYLKRGKRLFSDLGKLQEEKCLCNFVIGRIFGERGTSAYSFEQHDTKTQKLPKNI